MIFELQVILILIIVDNNWKLFFPSEFFWCDMLDVMCNLTGIFAVRYRRLSWNQTFLIGLSSFLWALVSYPCRMLP